MKFRNESGLLFKNISSEKERIYNFPNGSSLKIINPLYLHVSESGGHRIFISTGDCLYIKPSESWFITWTVKDDEPHFVK